MNIWLIQTGEIIPFSENDRLMRTGYLAKELIRRGHEVIWWTSAFEHQKRRWIKDKKNYNNIKNLEINFLKGCGYSKNLSIRRYIDHYLVAKDFKKKIQTFKKPDIIVASIPEHNLAFNASKYAYSNKIPLIIDLRDPWPDFFLSFINNKLLKYLARFLLSRDFYKSKYCLSNATSLVSMMNSLLKWGQQRGKRENINFDKVFYLGAKKISHNTNIKLSVNFEKLLNKINGSFNVLFIGTINNYYNPSTIIKAAKIINTNTETNNINFIIAGSGDLLSKLKDEASGIKNIYFPGWVNENQILKLQNVSDVGIIPAQLETPVLPNKAFTYFSGGLPVISSATGELSKMIEKDNIGLNFKKRDYAQLAENILYLFNSKESLKVMAENVSQLFEKSFRIEKIYEDYAKLIEKIVKND